MTVSMTVSGITSTTSSTNQSNSGIALSGAKRDRNAAWPTSGTSCADAIQFSGKARKRAKPEATEPDLKAQTDEALPPEAPSATRAKTPTQKASASPRVYGRTENNLREGTRIVLCDVAPLALSVLPLVGLPGVGFMFALATLPLSYLSGKLGRRIAKDINPNELNPVFQYVHRIKAAISSKPTGPNGNVVDVINKATEDLLNVRGLPAFATPYLLSLLKIKSNSRAAKLLTKLNGIALLRTEVNVRLAQSQNSKEASKAMMTGAKDFALFSGMNKLGTAMVTSSLPGAKWVGEGLKNAAWLKIAADLVSHKESKPLTQLEAV